MRVFTKEEIIAELRDIRSRGWIENRRHGNDGGIGNTVEDLLGIEENNIPLPNAAEWELKTSRRTSTALTTLIHFEPSPRAMKIVPSILLPQFGWKHKEAGLKYPETERSFRQTICGTSPTDRGFGIVINENEEKVEISFNASKVAPRHAEWLHMVERNRGLGDLEPRPYWGFRDLEHQVGTKMLNCFYVAGDVKKIDKKEHYHYTEIKMLTDFSFERFLDGLRGGAVYVDFDARTGHNHGTKMRIRKNSWPLFYDTITDL